MRNCPSDEDAESHQQDVQASCEKAASNAPLISRGDHAVLDLDNYIPFLLCAIGNKWSSSSSRIYLSEFGIGVTEWRIIAMLAIEPQITAYRICQVVGLDKAATSRALKSMKRRGLVDVCQEDPDNHRKIVDLTDKGRSMHDQIIRLAHNRERILVSGLSREEVDQLADYLRRLLQRVPDILTHDDD